MSLDTDSSAWDRMSPAERLEDAERQHADKLTAEKEVELLERALMLCNDDRNGWIEECRANPSSLFTTTETWTDIAQIKIDLKQQKYKNS